MDNRYLTIIPPRGIISIIGKIRQIIVIMLSKRMKIKTAAIVAFMAFLGTVAFGLIFMMDSNMKMERPMANECPFTAFGGKACSQNASGAVVHHISLYQSFTNVPVNFGMASLIFSLFLVVSAIIAIFINYALLAFSATACTYYNFPPATSYKRKISRWLSLHENSPAIV